MIENAQLVARNLCTCCLHCLLRCLFAIAHRRVLLPIKDFKMDHQTQTNNLNISISYRYIANIQKPDYPDFRWLAKDVETLLSNYPNKDDYWEIVNKQITSLLLNKYSGITSVTCEIKVDPSSLIPYTRSSRVTRERAPTKSNRKRT